MSPALIGSSQIRFNAPMPCPDTYHCVLDPQGANSQKGNGEKVKGLEGSKGRGLRAKGLPLKGCFIVEKAKRHSVPAKTQFGPMAMAALPAIKEQN